jgi:hypothetical protein
MSPKRFKRGQILVVFSLALPVLIGSIGLGADVAVLYFNWVEMQKAADAAAIAGANYLPGDPAQAQGVANSYAENNGIAQNEIASTTVAPDDLSITITVQRSVAYSFARVLGLTDAHLKAAATAGLQSNPDAARGVMPVGLPCTNGNCSYNSGKHYTLKPGPNGQLGPGNFAPLSLGGNGANVYRYNIERGYMGKLCVGQNIFPETGNVVGPTTQGFTMRIDLGQTIYPGANAASPSQYDPRLVIVPMVNYAGAQGKSQQVTIVNFALMFVDSVDGSSANLDAVYLGTVPPEDLTGSARQDFGMLTPILLQ